MNAPRHPPTHPRKPIPGTVNPLLSSNLSGIKTSINPPKYQCALDTFELAQKCRIKAVPFEKAFSTRSRAQSSHTTNYFFISISRVHSVESQMETCARTLEAHKLIKHERL